MSAGAAGAGASDAASPAKGGLASLFGLRRGGAPKSKATRAHLGDELSMYYNEEVRFARSTPPPAAGPARLCPSTSRAARRGPARPHAARSRAPPPQLKTWVERGKEAEARAAATLAPPPIPSRGASANDLAAAADGGDASGCVRGAAARPPARRGAGAATPRAARRRNVRQPYACRGAL
jgi:hypothetical protein